MPGHHPESPGRLQVCPQPDSVTVPHSPLPLRWGPPYQALAGPAVPGAGMQHCWVVPLPSTLSGLGVCTKPPCRTPASWGDGAPRSPPKCPGAAAVPSLSGCSPGTCQSSRGPAPLPPWKGCKSLGLPARHRGCSGGVRAGAGPQPHCQGALAVGCWLDHVPAEGQLLAYFAILVPRQGGHPRHPVACTLSSG